MSGQYATAMSSMDPEELAIHARGVPQVNTMLTADPPAHTRYKKLAMQAFTYKRVEQMGDYMATVTHRLIDGFHAGGGCEFKTAFADMLPSIVIADAFGVPHEDLDRFHVWLQAAIVRLSGTMASKEARLDAARKALELQTYMLGKIADRRAKPQQRPDLRSGPRHPGGRGRRTAAQRRRADLHLHPDLRRRSGDHGPHPDRRPLLPADPSRSVPDGPE